MQISAYQQFFLHYFTSCYCITFPATQTILQSKLVFALDKQKYLLYNIIIPVFWAVE